MIMVSPLPGKYELYTLDMEEVTHTHSSHTEAYCNIYCMYSPTQHTTMLTYIHYSDIVDASLNETYYI